jgi:hypothetical protein
MKILKKIREGERFDFEMPFEMISQRPIGRIAYAGQNVRTFSVRMRLFSTLVVVIGRYLLFEGRSRVVLDTSCSP